MNVNTQCLHGPALDWAVAQAQGDGRGDRYLQFWNQGGDKRYTYCEIMSSPSIYWDQGGPIIEKDEIYVRPTGDTAKWEAYVWGVNNVTKLENFIHHQYGATPLIAAMRCFVTKYLGQEVKIPDELWPPS